MTVAELILFVALAVGVYILFRPMQYRLQKYFNKLLGGNSRRKKEKPIIDIDDYRKDRE